MSSEDEELSAEELAGIEQYENSEEGQAPLAPNPGAELSKLFNKTAEMQECIATADSISNQLNEADTVAVKLQVPRELLRLTDFLEKKRAIAAGVEPLPTAEVLNQVLLNELHDQLHRLIVSPAGFRYYRQLWNRFCDEQNAPEQKIADPDAVEEGEEGPF
jgi:hypothetical protein